MGFKLGDFITTDFARMLVERPRTRQEKADTVLTIPEVHASAVRAMQPRLIRHRPQRPVPSLVASLPPMRYDTRLRVVQDALSRTSE